MKVPMRVSLTAAPVAVLCLLEAGCSGVTGLTPYSMQQSHEQIFDAPIVVVGVILSDTKGDKPVPSRRNGGYPMLLCRLTVRVENALRGTLTSGTHTVYYYHLGGAYSSPRPLGQWDGASRRIFWLRQDSGVLRTSCDGHDYCTIPVGSGSHPQYRPDPQKPLEYAVADILLTRGDGANDREFAKGFDYRGNIPEPYFFEKLQRLAATEVSEVRTAACKELSYYHQPCVEPGAKP